MLAINGGNPIREKAWKQWPIWGEGTKRQLESVLKNGRWAISGEHTEEISKCEEFERSFASFNNIEYCLTTDHGSSALLIALEVLGIGPGDEVIVPALTWAATAIAVCEVNATPILVDVDPNTYCVSIDAIQEAITPKTKAIIPVHLYGCMADMDEINKIAHKNNLFVIEDCAQTHGSIWNGKYAGTIGDIGAFSLQQSKVLTCGEGGVVLTSDQELYGKMFELRCYSRVYHNAEDLQVGKKALVEKGSIMGSNYCLSEFQSAVLLDQLTHLEEWNRIREENAIYLNEQLSMIPGIQVMYRHPQIERQSYYQYVFKVDPKFFSDKPVVSILKALEAELKLNLEQPYTPLHKSRLYRPYTKAKYRWCDEYVKSLSTERYSLPFAEKAANEGIIMHHSKLLGDKSDMDDIINAIKKVKEYSHTI